MEELDSFLNSEVTDDITRDETIQEGESLKADYVASLWFHLCLTMTDNSDL